MDSVSVVWSLLEWFMYKSQPELFVKYFWNSNKRIIKLFSIKEEISNIGVWISLSVISVYQLPIYGKEIKRKKSLYTFSVSLLNILKINRRDLFSLLDTLYLYLVYEKNKNILKTPNFGIKGISY